jgi:hypothetical protein
MVSMPMAYDPLSVILMSMNMTWLAARRLLKK